jgi:ABC-type lipoprotein export system ATPase subunit
MGIFQRLNEEMGITIMMITYEPDIALFAKRDILFTPGGGASQEFVGKIA